MIKEFIAVEMSTILDVCLNTYGTVNYLVKLMVDNNFTGVNSYPVAGQVFKYDDSLVYNLALQKNNKLKYATREKNPTNDDNMIYYSENYPAEYEIAAEKETVISLPAIPVGASIIRVDLEIKPLPLADWSWSPTARVLTLVNNDPDRVDDLYPTTPGQRLYVLYKIKKTTL